MTKRALIVRGGWPGHMPKECAEIFAPWLEAQDFEVLVSQTLDSLRDRDVMDSLNLVVPIWTMGEIDKEQSDGLLRSIREGVGIAGWHGGMCDAFRDNTDYQFMTGGQFVAHPGGNVPAYEVNIADPDHEIVRGLGNFTMRNTEQFYMHVDPSNRVLATTTFNGKWGDVPWTEGCVMPAVWTRMFGKGRVFYSSVGHTVKDFSVPEALEIVRRGMLWASR